MNECQQKPDSIFLFPFLFEISDLFQTNNLNRNTHELLDSTNCTNIEGLKQVILPYYEHFCDIYDMYGAFGRFDKADPDDAFELQKNEVKQWATDSKMIHGQETRYVV